MTISILCGDCRELLRQLPAASVHCVVTSPPYWGLRDYGTAKWEGGDPACLHVPDAQWIKSQINNKSGLNGGFDNQAAAATKRWLRSDGSCRCGAIRIDNQIGLEPTPDAYVANMIEIFREVRRVLRKDGTLWLNLGSSFASGDTNASRFRQRGHARAYGTDGKVPIDYQELGSFCSDLCDECLADFLNHHHHTLGIGQQPLREFSPALPTSHGNGHSDCVSAIQGALPHDVPVSTTIEFWRQHRGACSRCDSRAFGLSAVRSSSGDARASARIPWLNYTTFKPKDLVNVPFFVAEALRADGWYLRQDLIWSKPNPMPESVTDRCTKAHEYLFLLSKSERYFYDAQAIAERAIYASEVRVATPKNINGLGLQPTREYGHQLDGNRNKRSVWEVTTQPFSEAHFATFPPALIEPCIKAGCPAGGTVLDPFAGAGTTGLVADRLQRNAILIELNPGYAAMAERRLIADAPLFIDIRGNP